MSTKCRTFQIDTAAEQTQQVKAVLDITLQFRVTSLVGEVAS